MNIELTNILNEINNEVAMKNLTKEDIEKVASRAAGSFIGILSLEEIESCILNAFWKACDRYDNDKNCKFTTFFYKGVIMECLSQKKFNLNKAPVRLYEGIVSYNNNDFERVDILDEINTVCDDPQIVYDRFYKNMSINEIATNLGVCSETVRIRIKKNLKKLKRNLVSFSV